MSWTDERVEVLTEMWTDGKSAAEIAKELGGITRNAVIGKAHRLGLSGRASPIKKKPADSSAASGKAKPKKSTKATKAVKPVKAAKPTEEVVAERKQTIKKIAEKSAVKAASKKASENDGKGIGLLELTEKVCKWPIGDPQEADFYFCGKDSPQGVPYCPEHVGMAYQSPRKAGGASQTKGSIKIVADTVAVDDTDKKEVKK